MNSGKNSESELVHTTSSAEEIVEELYEKGVRRKFQEHLDDAVETIVDIAKNSKSDSVRRLAANDIIEHGHQRKGVDPMAGILDDGKLAIHVNLIQFESSDHGREVVRKRSRELKEINPVLEIDPMEALEEPVLDPELDLVLNNPGEKS